MYFYLAMVGFEPTPTATAAPSNTETTVIPSRPLRSYMYIYIYIRNILKESWKHHNKSHFDFSSSAFS